MRQHLPTTKFGGMCLFLGELAAARDHLEQGIAYDEAQTERSLASRYGFDPRVPCRAFRAYTLWLLGYPDQAVQQREAALALAQELSHPYTAAIARYVATAVAQFCRDGHSAQERAEALMWLSTEQKFTIFLAWGTILRGWALAERGQREEGIAHIREGLTICRAGGTELRWPYWLALLAEAYGPSGKAEDVLPLLAEALAAMDKTAECFWAAEIYRLKGEVLLRQAIPDAPQAESCLLYALDVAGHQQAKSLELRAAMSLARLWQCQGKRAAAYDLLAPIYGWFTEGFDTADLQEAKTLLDALA